MAGKTDYKNAWLAEKLDRINLTVPKGKKEIIQKMAADLGLSVNAFINQAIDEKIQKQSEKKKKRKGLSLPLLLFFALRRFADLCDPVR